MSRSSASAQPSRRLQLQRLLETVTGAPRQRDDAHCRDLVGIDVTDGRLHSRPSLFLPFLIASLIAALFLVGLRSELTAMRYAIPEALAQEEQLRAEKRALTVEMRRLRDPSRLAARARNMGFVHPEHIVDLPAGELRSRESTAAERQSRESKAAERQSRESKAAKPPVKPPAELKP